MIQCCQCGQSILDGEEVVSKHGDDMQIFCRPCATARAGGAKPAGNAIFHPSPAAPAVRQPRRTEEITRFAGALFLGALAAAVGMLIWYAIVTLINWYISLIAGGVGFLVGYAVVFGARGDRGIRMQVLSVTLTLVAMLVGQGLIGYRDFALPHATGVVVPEFTSVIDILRFAMLSIRYDPLILFFWAVSIYGALYIPRELHQH